MRGDVFAFLVTILNPGFIQYGKARTADIVFPGDSRTARDVSDPCKDQNYCTVKPKDYPEDMFKELFKNHKVLPRPRAEEKINFETRLGDTIEQDNCATEVTHQPLYLVREKREEPWRVVIQVPEINFRQIVRMERCLNPEARCFTAFPDRPDYVTFCKQKYMVWEVLVAKPNNQTEVIKPQLPVCCSCHYRPLSFVARISDED